MNPNRLFFWDRICPRRFGSCGSEMQRVLPAIWKTPHGKCLGISTYEAKQFAIVWSQIAFEDSVERVTTPAHAYGTIVSIQVQCPLA